MYFHSLNFNRCKKIKIVFSVFLIVGVLNWVFIPSVTAYAEGEVSSTENTPAVSSTSETSAPASNQTVETGEAVSQTNIQNEVNTNKVTVEASKTGESDTKQTEKIQNTEEGNDDAKVDIQNKNKAEIQNTATTTAETGSNNAEGKQATTTIVTGDAVASADTVNLVNTNVVNSKGDIVVGSGSLGDSSLDLRNDFSEQSSSTCDNCLGDISIKNQNMATVTNDITVSAKTGNNNASSTEASITTGNAYAGANVINIANTNIVKSNYTLLVFNNFGDWSGDLIFPNGDFFSHFLSDFASNCVTCGGDTKVSNNNKANVSNSVDTSADSGGNKASGKNASINSGNSLASSNVYNKINTNIYGKSSFYLLIKVFGDWNGDIFNLPKNIVWKKTSKGVVLYNKDGGNPFENKKSTSEENNISVKNNNDAKVSNNIKVNATTGNNNADGENNSIKTGNAYAGSNQINIINTNIVSSNWTAALVNVLGNWQGNVSFGQPDLWIGTVAESAGSLKPGSSVKFTTTIKNNGDATASGIKVITKPQEPFLNIAGKNEWSLGPLVAGESTKISYYGTITGNHQPGRSNITNKTSVSLKETDANIKDNTDTITLSVYTKPTIILPYTSRTTSYANLKVTKTHSIPSAIIINGIEMVPFEGSADYKIVVKNNGGAAYEGLLIDQLKNEDGKVINEQTWKLGKILPDEEITVTYTNEFTASTTPGTYTNFAWVEALSGDYSFDPNSASIADSNMASDKIIIAKKPVIQIQVQKQKKKLQKRIVVGEVLGLSTKNISIINHSKPYKKLLTGFCYANNKVDKTNTLSFSQSALLGLSFILIMRKKKYIPTNLLFF